MMDIEQKKPLWQRLGWLVLIWALSVAALGVFAYGMRMFMSAAGLSTH
ncbi:DUF2474 domain-containing protein [Pseudomonas sichuanensis]